MKRTDLLFIPGLGDRTWLYRLATPIWRALGYEAHIFRFGWKGDGALLPSRQQALVQYVDKLGSVDLVVVGVSAGGTAAVTLLRDRPMIRRLATVASPLMPKDFPVRPLLEASINQTDKFLASTDARVRSKIISVHGRRDWRVPITKSRREGLATMALPGIGHNLIITLALTVFARRIAVKL